MLFFSLLAILAIACLAARELDAAAGGDPPNIILVLANSLGRGDLLAEEKIQGYSTPHITKMANEDGTRLTKYYVQAENSPTRAALLTGRYPFNMGLQHQLVPGTTAAIPLEVPTLAEMLEVQGYVCHMVGTWDLGYARLENTPTNRGYSTFYGHLGPEVDYFNKTFANGFDFWDEVRGTTFFKRAAFSEAGAYSTKQYQVRTRQIIEKHAREAVRQPLFITIAHQAAKYDHRRLLDDSRCRKSSISMQRRPHCSSILALDDAMGDLRKVLEERAMWSNTIIVFSTDSGGLPPTHGFLNETQEHRYEPRPPGGVGSNFPLRGTKATLYEGGVLGVAFVSGGALPSKYKKKQITDLAHAVDVPLYLLTLAWGGVNTALRAAAKYKLDGHALFSTQARTEVPIHIEARGRSFSSIRMGEYKLIVGRAQRGEAQDGYWRKDGTGLLEPAPRMKKLHWLLPFQLFNLDRDPLERENLVYNQTSLVLLGRRRILDRVREVAGLYREPMLNLLHPLALPRFHNQVWAPFLTNHPP